MSTHTPTGTVAPTGTPTITPTGTPNIATPPGLEHLDLELTGMTCAACANRIEKKLNRLDGVTATVNYATEKATVHFDAGHVSADQLVEAVESIGYGAHLPSAVDDGTDPNAERLDDLRRRLVVAVRNEHVLRVVLGQKVLARGLVGDLVA